VKELTVRETAKLMSMPTVPMPSGLMPKKPLVGRAAQELEVDDVAAS
jgi:hypothetical protein